MDLRLYILWIWKIWDPIYYSFTRLQYIEPAGNKKTVFRVRLTKYKGKEVILSDGTRIRKNDVLLKIHLHNVRLLSEILNVKHELNKGRCIYKMVLYSMPVLADYIKNHPEEQKIKGIIGITMINKGVRHLGFECFFPENIFYLWLKKVSQLPIFFLSTSTMNVQNFKKHNPVYLMMSKEHLIKKYQTVV